MSIYVYIYIKKTFNFNKIKQIIATRVIYAM